MSVESEDVELDALSAFSVLLTAMLMFAVTASQVFGPSVLWMFSLVIGTLALVLASVQFVSLFVEALNE